MPIFAIDFACACAHVSSYTEQALEETKRQIADMKVAGGVANQSEGGIKCAPRVQSAGGMDAMMDDMIDRRKQQPETIRGRPRPKDSS